MDVVLNRFWDSSHVFDAVVHRWPIHHVLFTVFPCESFSPITALFYNPVDIKEAAPLNAN